MYILNTTYLVESPVELDWIQWVQDIFVPLLTEHGTGVGDSTFTKVLSTSDADGETFSIQLRFADLDHLTKFRDSRFNGANSLMETKFQGKYLLFQTVMKVL